MAFAGIANADVNMLDGAAKRDKMGQVCETKSAAKASDITRQASRSDRDERRGNR